MHIERVDTEVVGGQVDALEDLSKRQALAISEQNLLIRALLHLALDKSQKVLLVHTSGMVDVGVHFPDIVEVSVGYLLRVGDFLIFIEQGVQIVATFQILQSSICEALGWSVGSDVSNGVEGYVVIPQRRHLYDWPGCFCVIDLIYTAFVKCEFQAQVRLSGYGTFVHVEIFSYCIASFPSFTRCRRLRHLDIRSCYAWSGASLRALSC